ncbi:alkaline phosphatase family protein [Rhodococcus sp. WAY2]|uniref:alkaline phosphatase family protein n=1 Tax=Rhodococcus sp. WAY2 TaxID=2663121 RepID=UPI00131FFDFE|nr:nucleotide pyrophosphatase/phosphodiesterase family protein [Rhodococcus sp. WAY2]QHE70734.1 Alkaline phosphodiesterase I / Nucleotide pyrophosphatase [Rhodococcus sp. WAY2]
MTTTAPALDVYSQPTLSTLMPSVLASLGVAGEANPLELPDSRHTVVLLLDGLGWNALNQHRDHAPFLCSLAGRPIRAGFPTTTATSIASLGTGLPSGSHGITGYQSYVREVSGTLNWLSWRAGRRGDELARLVPEVALPTPTVFERAAAEGIRCVNVLPAKFDGSGLTRAVLRGGTFTGIHAYGDLIAQVITASRAGDRTLTYCYLSEIDTLGHVYGPGSESWTQQVAIVDSLVENLARALATVPGNPTLYITADHGMVTVDDVDKLDFDADSRLSDDVIALAGEPRCRHVHTRTGAAGDVAARWRQALGPRMWIGTRDEAITAGLFGPAVRSDIAGRIGDVVAIALDGVAVVRRKKESRLSALPGQHGALTDDELLIPLLHTAG